MTSIHIKDTYRINSIHIKDRHKMTSIHIKDKYRINSIHIKEHIEWLTSILNNINQYLVILPTENIFILF
jgi:hypothetical protein